MMKHWNKARRHKLTKSRVRGNLLVWKEPGEVARLEAAGLLSTPAKG
jgi:hypothetical protein